MDLFDLLSERGEMLDQLGRNGIALKAAAWVYFFASAFFSFIFIMAKTGLAAFSATLLVFTAFILLTILLSEAGNSLINPVEGLVLAHQPVNGATYTAAKLSHLARIVLFLVPGLNLVPSLAGLALKGATWTFPIWHMAAALTVGFVTALFCCAVFGWLIRFVPVRRLRAAGQLAAAICSIGVMWVANFAQFLARLDLRRWLPESDLARWSVMAALTAAALLMVGLGIRALSADYLIRVSGLVRGGRAVGGRSKRSRLGDLVSRYFGGQPARAGFAFTSRMMLRDWQFHRQLLPTLLLLAMSFTGVFLRDWRGDPFSGSFTPVHAFPHLCGALLFFVCTLLAYGSDYKGTWLFLSAPSRVWTGFARGVHALLWIGVIVIPHLVLLGVLIWAWGIASAALFTAYSVAVASAYLALDLRLIEGTPFSQQVDATRGAVMLPLMLLGGAIVGVAMAFQYFVVFRSLSVTMAVTVVVAAGAWVLTRSSLRALEESIRHHLSMLAIETGKAYQEIAA